MNKCTKTRNGRARNVIFSLLISVVFFLFISGSEVAIDYMKKGLELCARTVIPSLFPLMAISQLAVRFGSGRLLGKLFSLPAKWLLGVGEDSACAFVFGAVCGFPIGASTLCDAYDSGRISKREFVRSLTFCNNPGAAFVISAVGVSLFGSLRLGIVLFGCVILSALAVGVAQRLIFGSVVDENEKFNGGVFEASGGIISYFTSAIQSSALSMLTVCAYVVFFSALVGCIGAVLSKIGANSTVIATIFGFFELSGGVRAAAELSPAFAIILSSVALGWSGLSVHCQIMTICAGRGISFKPYFFAKAVQSLVCAALVYLVKRLPVFSEDAFAEVGRNEIEIGNSPLVIWIFVAFCALVAVGFLVRILRRNRVKKFF